MMMMPFVRLIAIYAIVGAAIFAFLKRDEIMAYMNTPEDTAVATRAEEPALDKVEAPAAQAEASAAEDTAPVGKPAAEATPGPASAAAPAFGTQISPQYFGQAAPAPAPAPQAGNDLVERWSKAREVFSKGKPADAAALYEALLLDFPDNADLHGETGNLYYNLGDFGNAATHYQAVGEIAGRAGNRQMAGSMLALLQRIAPAKAAELQATLNAGQ